MLSETAPISLIHCWMKENRNCSEIRQSVKGSTLSKSDKGKVQMMIQCFTILFCLQISNVRKWPLSLCSSVELIHGRNYLNDKNQNGTLCQTNFYSCDFKKWKAVWGRIRALQIKSDTHKKQRECIWSNVSHVSL